MSIRERAGGARRRIRARRPMRWRPRIEALESLIVMNGADLVVSAAVAPTILDPSVSSAASWTIANRGTEAADASWTGAVFLSKDAALDAADLPMDDPQPSWGPLAPGGFVTQSATVDAAVPAGDYYLLFVADPDGVQAEADEFNNVRALPVKVVGSSAPLADLTITGATAPTSAEVGTIPVSWTVKNQGAGAAASWSDAFYLSSDANFDASDLQASSYYHYSDTLADGASESYDTTIGLPSVPAGSYFLLFVANNGFGSVPEGDASNNVFAVPIVLTVPDADLVVTDASAPDTAVSGGSVDLSWTVENQGNDPAKSSWSDNVYLSTDTTYDGTDRSVTSYYNFGDTPMAPGDSYTRELTATLPAVAPGSYYLIFVADGYEDQAESNEENNARAVAITITPADVDLELTSAEAPDSAKPGPVALSWTVTNRGADAADGSWYDYVYLSKDQAYDSTDTFVATGYRFSSDPLAGGASYTTTQDGTLPGWAPGDYYLLFVANGYHNVAETDEDNNVLAVPITLEASDVDLVVTDATAPATAERGGTADVSWTVANQGTDPATSSWSDYVYLSTDDHLDPFGDVYVGSYSPYTHIPLAGGDSYTAHLTVSIPSVPAGTYYLLFATNYYRSQPETDADNNVFAVPIELTEGSGSPVDLAISDVQAPGSGTPGGYVPLSWVVTNVGTAPASDIQLDGVYLSADSGLDPAYDATLASLWIASSQAPLAPGASYIVSTDVLIPGGTATGDYHLLIAANPDEDQPEGSFENNVADVAFSVASGAAAAPKVASFAVNDGGDQRSMVTSLTLTFDGVVTVDDGAFRLVRDDGQVIDLVAAMQVVGGQTIATLTFNGVGVAAGSLADGRYTLTALSDHIRDDSGQALDGDGDGSPGGDYVDHVFRLFGDADGDGDVDNKDFFTFRTTANKGTGDIGFLWFLDANDDGIVDLATDYAAFKAQNRKTIG